ncbi:MAG: bifunctional precorrin-2 dehydrogenase/sirohydrochlorin ferrochelatase [Deltaproteobacteria bacterium]|nr:bifunctional precorrin-2 dehydrogenase/sirohydrochlorin ferrochelatase [Deltaproteobacteria bacterium]MDZ4344623.1 bifunctional precorrin-2 dehydrogenase/sirohydrochlorin ferrochelatase [Candidatus Binatia bacterium]
MSYFPIILEMTGRRCLVIGGGLVAERKIAGLLDVGAEVTVISPKVTEAISHWSKNNSIQLEGRCYRIGDLAGYQLVFVATDDADVNDRVYQEGKSCGVWVNAADDPDHCDFILPAVIRRGDLAVAISTGGASPAATRAIREELDDYFTAEYAQLVQVAAEVRMELKEKTLNVGAGAWNSSLKGEFRRLIRAGRPEQAKEFLLKTLGARS